MAPKKLAVEIKYNLKHRQVKIKKVGRQPVAMEDKKIMVYGMVNRKHHGEAQKAVQELIQQWR